MQISVSMPGQTGQSFDATSPAAVYSAYSEQASRLRDQRDGLQNERGAAVRELGKLAGSEYASIRVGLNERIARLDTRIAGVEEQIAQADGQVAKAASVPGSVVPSRAERTDNGEEVFFGGVGTGFALILFLYLMRWKLWRRKGTRTGRELRTMPGDIAARMDRLESVTESTAVEIERIGEGQRFITRLLSEQTKSAMPAENRGQ